MYLLLVSSRYFDVLFSCINSFPSGAFVIVNILLAAPRGSTDNTPVASISVKRVRFFTIFTTPVLLLIPCKTQMHVEF